MPIRIDDDLPVKKTLEDENIFVMGTGRAHSQDIRPLDILILNLMPLKEDTELQLMRSLSNTPLQVNITLLRTMSYESKNVTKGHLDRFYEDFDSVKNRKWDGFIITGAPVERWNLRMLTTGMNSARSWIGPRQMSHRPCTFAGAPRRDSTTDTVCRSSTFRRNCQAYTNITPSTREHR